MGTDSITEEQIAFTNGLLRLSGILAYPNEVRPLRAVLLCSPHPQFAGDMENNVILELARHFATDSITLRFDYRGVGKSAIELPPGENVFDYWQRVEEMHDYGDAVSDAQAAAGRLLSAAKNLPCAVVGYSFGVATGFHAGMQNADVGALVGIAPPLGRVDFTFLRQCTKPCMFIVGKEDFLYSAEQVELLGRTIGSPADVKEWPDSDHFFRGEERRLAEEIGQFLREQLPEAKE